jgi:hypothetical protein
MHHSEGREVVFIDKRVFGEEKDDGGNDVSDGDFMALDDLAELFYVESLHYDYADSAVYREVEEYC